MAYDKLVDSAALDAGLKTIADAIREKGGTTDSLAFPDAMVAAIAAIEAGGGSTILGFPFICGSYTLAETPYVDTQLYNMCSYNDVINAFGSKPTSFVGGWWLKGGYKSETGYSPFYGLGVNKTPQDYIYMPAVGNNSGTPSTTGKCNILGILRSESKGVYISTANPYVFRAGDTYEWILIDLSGGAA